MMFPWGIAKSAEAVFSRWAVKRVCKFLLKKKLGKLLLGDIDLDQLDVQLRDGTIRLIDLALNVDYLNEKFDAPVFVKEGSIGSLLVKMPWKSKGCQVEVDELELVLAPRLERNSSTLNEASTSTSTRDASHSTHLELGKHENDLAESAVKSASIDVHEGVKTVAKIVKWFLTSFHVKIKKLIIAFDPCFGEDQKQVSPQPTLVFRMSEIECGTCVSEDPVSTNEVAADNFLGISRLTNFVKFQGVVLDLLQMDDDDGNKTCDAKPSNAVTSIMTGKGGGFSGSLNLSIPWRHGSLDVRKVDADLCIDPIEVRFQPATIKWFLHSWETFMSLDSECFGLVSHFDTSTDASPIPTNKVTSVQDTLSSSGSQEIEDKTTLPGLRFIPDWVPSSFSKKEEDGEVDFGASVDQFFECFDGMRSYQSAFGSQGVWNWTSSVFTAITAASSLASGTLHLPSEHQHVQTSFKVSFAGISVVLFFHDEDNWKDVCMGVHYLGAECRDISFSVQVCPQEMRLEGKVNNIEITDYFHAHDITDTADIECQTALIKNLQAEVENALPLFPSPGGNADSNEVSGIVTDGFLSRNKGFAVKTLLVRAAGGNGFQFTINSQSSDRSFCGSKSFSLSLPPTTVWLNLHSVKRLVNLITDVTKSIPETSGKKSQVSSPSHSENDAASRARVTAPSKPERLRGNVSIQNARAILCFPYEGNTKRLHNSLGEQFVVIDLSPPLSSENERLENRSPGERYFALAASSICFGIGDASIYLVISDFKEAETNSYNIRGDFSAYKILHTCNGTGHRRSSITLFWQDSPVTGPCLLERARNLATQEESMQSNKCGGNGLEFAAVTPAKDDGDIYSQTRKEITLGSSFCIWVHLFHPSIHLDSSLYSNTCHLLDQTKSWLTCMADGTAERFDEPAAIQTSLIMECDLFEILVTPDTKDDVKNPLQIELPGSWIQLKLVVHKLSLLSVSNLGNAHGADFFWLAHDEGKLWGSVSGFPDWELLLISCSNSAMKRGNGGGSNALSSRLAGLDIVHLQDPKICHGFLSISLRCSTIVAVGGRLDWAEVASSFFILPSTETVQVDNVSQDRNASSSSSPFILSLVDVGLSYEPHFENADPFYQSSESWIACLLAASSFSLSNVGLVDSMGSGYKIRLQDLGLLLSVVNDPNRLGGTYSVEYLHETGYVKVAQEALVEAILRTNCENGLLWELECSESHLLIETCYDTTSGLIRLAAQIQQLFAPDLEESAVHLQTRSDNIHPAHARNDFDARNIIFGSESSSGKMQNSSLAPETESGLIGLMDEINQDAFNFEANMTSHSDSFECQSHRMSSDDSFHGEACTVILGIPDTLSSDQFICGSSSEIVPESSQTFLERDSLPELIENYLSDLRPLSEVPLEGELLGWESVHEADMKRGNSGWYDDGSLRIVEDHVSEATEEDCEEHTLDGNSSLFDSSSDSVENALGRVLLKNINLKWRMYSGSDWHDHGKKSEIPRNMKGRDTNACLELELSAMQFQYEVFPVGGICASKLSLVVHDFYLYDRSKAAPWKLVLGYYNSKDRPRDSSSKALKMDLKAVRPEPQTPLEEYRLRIAFLPVLLHLHQSQLDFLISFFGGNSSEKPLVSAEDSGAWTSSIIKSDSVGHNINEEALLPYFQKFDIWPVTIRIDYSPHHVDLAALTGGKYAELVNLVPWKGVELKLKHVHAAGIYGWGGVCETILGEWLEDISQNQIHKLLRGIPTVRSLSALYAGAAKLISLPVKSYRKDRRVVQGMQRGTIALLRSISLEAVGLGVHLAAGAHDILLRAEYVLASSPTVSQSQEKKKAHVRHNQPRNAGQGMLQACESISDGLGKSASALVRKPFKQYQRGASMGSALATAVQGVPTAAIAPASACARAVQSALIGIRNSLDPEHKRESMEKYLGPGKRHNQN